MTAMLRDDALQRFDALLEGFDRLERADRPAEVETVTLAGRFHMSVPAPGFKGYRADDMQRWSVRAEAALIWMFGERGPHIRSFRKLLEESAPNSSDVADQLRAVIQAARDEIEDGWVVASIQDQARAETEQDLLNLSRRLLEQGDAWRAAAAVTAGAAVELHLRYLCVRHDIEWNRHGSIGAYANAIRCARPDKEAYPVDDDPQIERWRRMRNHAAHRPTTFDLSSDELRAACDLIEAFIQRTT